MVDLSDYERRGDLDAPLVLTKKHERAQQKAVRLYEALSDIAPLTWEAYVASKPCPGCGRPYRDSDPWEFKGTMYFTDQERARYEAEDARFLAAHGGCHASRLSVSGSLTMHCMRCCPMPPLSPDQRERVRRRLATPRQPHELMRWRLRLYCGHVVEKQAHFTHRTLHSAFMGPTSCPQCGLDPATIVDAEPIGLVEEPPASTTVRATRRATVTRKPTRAELEAKVRDLETEVEQLRLP